MTSIGNEVFAACTSLWQIDLQSSTVQYVPRDFLSGTAVTEITLPATITSVSQIDENAFRGTSINYVVLAGFSDKYISENLSKFGRFGSSSSITFVSSSGIETALNTNGKGLKGISTYVISIGIDHDGTDRGVGKLKGIHKDVETLYGMVKQAYADNMN